LGLAENLREQTAELVDEEEFTSHVSITLIRTSSSGNELIMVYSLISIIFFGVNYRWREGYNSQSAPPRLSIVSSDIIIIFVKDDHGKTCLIDNICSRKIEFNTIT
jgi:hypothetical protein